MFSWEGTALHSLDPKTLRSSVLTFTPRLQDRGTNFTCWVKHQGAQAAMERTIQLNISCECWRDGWSLGADEAVCVE